MDHSRVQIPSEAIDGTDGEVTELDGPLSLKLLPGAIDIACP